MLRRPLRSLASIQRLSCPSPEMILLVGSVRNLYRDYHYNCGSRPSQRRGPTIPPCAHSQDLVARGLTFSELPDTAAMKLLPVHRSQVLGSALLRLLPLSQVVGGALTYKGVDWSSVTVEEKA